MEPPATQAARQPQTVSWSHQQPLDPSSHKQSPSFCSINAGRGSLSNALCQTTDKPRSSSCKHQSAKQIRLCKAERHLHADIIPAQAVYRRCFLRRFRLRDYICRVPAGRYKHCKAKKHLHAVPRYAQSVRRRRFLAHIRILATCPERQLADAPTQLSR